MAHWSISVPKNVLQPSISIKQELDVLLEMENALPRALHHCPQTLEQTYLFISSEEDSWCLEDAYATQSFSSFQGLKRWERVAIVQHHLLLPVNRSLGRLWGLDKGGY